MAGVPVVDPAMAALTIQNMLADAQAWAKEEVIGRAKMELQETLSINQQVSDENIAANTIVRITEAIEKTHELNIAKEATPLVTSCVNVSSYRALESSDNNAQAVTGERISMASNLERSVDSPVTHTKLVSENLVQRMDAIDNLANEPALYLRADSFLRIGKYSNKTYTLEEEEASKVFAELLKGPYRTVTNPKATDPSDPRYAEYKVLEEAQRARKSLAYAIIEDYRSTFIADPQRGVSKMAAIQDFVADKRILDPSGNWTKTFTCTKASDNPTIDCANDSAVLKEMLQLEAYQTFLISLIAEEERRANLLSATKLAINIES